MFYELYGIHLCMLHTLNNIKMKPALAYHLKPEINKTAASFITAKKNSRL